MGSELAHTQHKPWHKRAHVWGWLEVRLYMEWKVAYDFSHQKLQPLQDLVCRLFLKMAIQPKGLAVHPAKSDYVSDSILVYRTCSINRLLLSNRTTGNEQLQFSSTHKDKKDNHHTKQVFQGLYIPCIQQEKKKK